MPVDSVQIRKDALTLPPVERAALVEVLLESLAPTDPSLEELWVREAKYRIAAFEAGEMDAIPAEEVFREFETP